MFPPRAVFLVLVVLFLATFAVADIESNTARMNRSVLLTPIRVLGADSSFTSTVTDFRPLRNESATPFEEVGKMSAGEFGAVVNLGRRSRPSTSSDDISLEVSRPVRKLRAPIEQAPVVPVPEPASIALLASGLLSLGLGRLKK